MRITDEEQIERVRAAAADLLARQFSGNESALARALKIDQSTVSRFLAGPGGTSLDTAERIAQLARVPLATLLGLVPESGDQRRVETSIRFSDLAGWSEAETRIRASVRGRRYTEEAWELARQAKGGKMPPRLEDHFVVQLLDLWQSVADAIADENDEELAEIEKQYEIDKQNTKQIQAHAAEASKGARGKAKPVRR